jgi:glycosyltransferase involved in cell wall biosynthesis
MQMFKDNGFFVITGDGPLRDDVLAIAAKYKLSNFKWIPLLERPEQLYAVLSGLVITGAFAQQGSTVMLQALACGVPVFSTDVAESRRVLGLYGSGLVVKHDPERKDFADCFKLWKDNLDIYKTAAMETADLIRKH